MTLNADNFTSVDALSLRVDSPVLASHWRALAHNVNHMQERARGRCFDQSVSMLAHDHAANGGPPIPLFLQQPFGAPAVSMCNGTDSLIPLTRIHASTDFNDYLQRPAAPYPTINGTLGGNMHQIWMSGNWESHFADGRYIVLDDGVNTGRYRYKMAEYHSSLNATLLSLWDALTAPAANGTTLVACTQRGHDEAKLFVPEWANWLTCLLPVCATISVSTEAGERLMPLDNADNEWWMMRSRLACDGLKGQWVLHYPRRDWTFAYTVHRLDLRTLRKKVIHSFSFELDFNDSLESFTTMNIGPHDATLWFTNPAYGTRPRLNAIFSR